MKASSARYQLPWRALANSRLLNWLVVVIFLVGLSRMCHQFPSSEFLREAKGHQSHQKSRNLLLNHDTEKTSSQRHRKDAHSAASQRNRTVKYGTGENYNLMHNNSQEFPFRYLINEKEACTGKVNIINIIPIAPASVHSRYKIRNQWGNQSYLAATGMKTLFMVGRSNISYHQDLLEYESDFFHDIIQLDFIDSYFNLTLKTLSILHWTKTYCSRARWILKSDEDVFVNPFGLKKFVSRRGRKADFICKMNNNLKVCRSEKECRTKWVVTKEQYSDDYYPPYCNGPAYVVSRNMARKLYQISDKTSPFLMEDAYFTGILAQPLKPYYYNLNRSRFPKKIPKIKQHHWTGYAVLILDVDKHAGKSHILWNKILIYNKCQVVNETRLVNTTSDVKVVQNNQVNL